MPLLMTQEVKLLQAVRIPSWRSVLGLLAKRSPHPPRLKLLNFAGVPIPTTARGQDRAAVSSTSG